MPLRFNHMELTLPKGALTHEREAITGFYGQVFGFGAIDVPLFFVATMRATGTMAMWVSGNKLTLAGVGAAESSISVPVSAIAQKQPVMPTVSVSIAARTATSSPAATQSSPARSAVTTARGGSNCAAR